MTITDKHEDLWPGLDTDSKGCSTTANTFRDFVWTEPTSEFDENPQRVRRVCLPEQKMLPDIFREW